MGGIERRAKVPTVSEWNTSNYSRVRIATEKNNNIYILPSQMAISPSTCGFFSAGVPYRPQSDMYTQCGFTNREANRAPKRYCIWNRIDPNTEIAQTLLVGRKRECKVFWCVYLFLFRFFLSRFFLYRSFQPKWSGFYRRLSQLTTSFCPCKLSYSIWVNAWNAFNGIGLG